MNSSSRCKMLLEQGERLARLDADRAMPPAQRGELLQGILVLDAHRLRYVAGVRRGLRRDGPGQAADRDGSQDDHGWHGNRW